MDFKHTSFYNIRKWDSNLPPDIVMSNNQNEFPRNLGMYLSDFLLDRREKQRYLASGKKKKANQE